MTTIRVIGLAICVLLCLSISTFLSSQSAIAQDVRGPIYTVEVQSTFTSVTASYLERALRQAESANATALIIVHNHPSGDPMPSGPDIEMTRRIAAVLDGLNITLQDSIIIGRFGFTSLRARGLL